MSIPITFIVDDSSPLINAVPQAGELRPAPVGPSFRSGQPVPPEALLDFLREFVAVIARWGIRGKFSVIPYPAALGKISEGWPGCDMRAIREWIGIVARDVTPLMDITPEMITHSRTLDLKTLTLLDENERDWASHQTEATLTPYIATALRFLKEVGLEANGVTSPWNFGTEVEPDYQRAIRAAMKEVNGLGQTWYFLHIGTEGTEFLSRVVFHDGDEWLVSICSQCGDFLQETSASAETGPAFVRSVVDKYLTEDGRQGRLAELFGAGIPIVFHSHWWSLMSRGDRTGLRALDELGRRVRTIWGERVRWVKCSELAAELASGAQWPARPARRRKRS
jgi:hypothetical protein